MAIKTFDAVLLSTPKFPNAAYVDIPFNVEEEYGKKGQVKILATIDGIPYRGSLAKMGSPNHILIVLKAIREKLGKTHGDVVSITLQQDTAPREVAVPEELQMLLNAEPKAKEFFEGLAYTYKKEYVKWVTSAKREETRQRRLAQTIEKLKAGVKAP